jgi:hypothetical protein
MLRRRLFLPLTISTRPADAHVAPGQCIAGWRSHI